MKSIIRPFNVLIALVTVATLTSFAQQDTRAEKSKSYSKSYSLGNSDKISLSNSFGEMKINTWEKNEIKVDVAITSKAATDARAQEIIDRISIEDGKNGGEVFFKTKFKDDKGNHNNESFKVNYIVYVPANNKLEASNSFGPLVIGDFSGPIKISSKFGSLNAGKLSHPESVTVEFGKGTIESINGGKLSVKYSSALVNRISGEIDGAIEFSTLKLVLDNSLKKLDVSNSYTTLLLDADNNLSASFNIKSSFGGFSNKTDFQISDDKSNDEGRRFNPGMHRNYSGKAGSGSTPINIKNSFGHITLGHNLPFDVNEKGKNHKSVRV